MLIFAAIIAALVLLAVALPLRNMHRRRRSGQSSFTGVGTPLGALNEIFQPHLPTVEQVQKLQEEGEEDEGEGNK